MKAKRAKKPTDKCLHCLNVKMIEARNLCRKCWGDTDIRYQYPAKDNRDLDGTLKCSIEGCDKKHKGNTYCCEHNQKFKKYGDPLGEHPNETKRKQRKERLEKLALEGMKECFDCEQALPFDSFTRSMRTKDNKKWDHGNTNLSTYCRDCQQNRQKKYKAERPWWHNYVTWSHKIKANYGITVDDYCRMWLEQNGVCKICKGWYKGKTSGANECSVFCVDHCHDTNVVRGLLCSDCNTCLGSFKDDIEKLKEAIRYLEAA